MKISVSFMRLFIIRLFGRVHRFVTNHVVSCKDYTDLFYTISFRSLHRFTIIPVINKVPPKTIALIFLICLMVVNAEKANAQCTGCTTTLNNFTSSSNYTFAAGTKTCFIGTSTINSDVTFGNNASICVGTGATLNFGGNNYNVNNSTDLFTIDVYGTLNVNQNPTWKGKMLINVHSGAILSIPNTITLNGPTITLINDGKFNVGTIQFEQAGATITIINNSEMTVSGQFNISNGNAYFKNTGTLSVANNYNSSPTSTYVNCGTYTGKFNLRGGKVINTGTFNTSQIDYSSNASRIENYGRFNVSGNINLGGSGSVFYNAGITTFTSGLFQADGNLTGPSDSTKKGYFVWSQANKATINNGTIGPNLNFRNSNNANSSNVSTMFNNSQNLIWLSNITWGLTEPASLPATDCPAPDGTPAVPVPLETIVCPGVNLSSLHTSYSNIIYEWWTGNSTTRTAQITSSTTPSVTNYTTVGTVYLWARNVSSGVYSAQGGEVVISGSCKNLWVGSTNTTTGTDWNTATNWTAGVVPAPSQDIVFATAANNPLVSGVPTSGPAVNNLVVPVGQSKIIGKLTNGSDKALIIPAGTSVTVQGDVSGFDATPEKLRLLAEENKANGTFIALNSCNTTILGTVQLFAKGKKGVEITWKDNIVGSPTFDQSFTSSYQWQFFGVPVETLKASPTFDGGFMRKYNEAINKTSGNSNNNLNGSYYYKWEKLNNASNLTAFTGYEITQDNPTTYTIKGRLQLCDKIIKLTRSAVEVPGSTDTNEANKRYGLGQNIFGNSFTAAIPVKDLTFPANVEQTVYLYNTGSFGNWTTGIVSETTTDAGSYLSIPYNISSALDVQIPSMQGFLLMHTGTIGTSIDMTLPYSKLTRNQKPQTAPRKELSYLHVNLASNSTRDNLWLFSQEGTTEKFDDGWDGRKFFGTPTAFIYTENADGPMQVNTDETIDGTVLNFYANQDTEYTLTLTKSNLDNYRDLHLIDLVTHTATPLTGELTTYLFTADNKGNTTKRFIIANSPYRDLNSDKFQYLDGYVMNNNRLIINNFTPMGGTMNLYDTTGRTLMTRNLTPAVNEIPVQLNSGIYILNLQADGKQETIKLIIQQEGI